MARELIQDSVTELMYLSWLVYSIKHIRKTNLEYLPQSISLRIYGPVSEHLDGTRILERLVTQGEYVDEGGAASDAVDAEEDDRLEKEEHRALDSQHLG